MNSRHGRARRHACIVGAGIVGSATAYALAREGWQVTLVDALPAAGQGASLANGAQLSYSYVEPLATPAALRALPTWLLSRDSPLRWRPRPAAAHLSWLSAFIGACRTQRARDTTAALLALARLSRHTLDGWLAELPGLREAARHAQPGKLVMHRDPEARAGAERQLAWQASLGCQQQLVSAQRCVDLEPALAACGHEIAFGVWTPDEQVIDGAALAQRLAQASGARLRLGRRVRGFATSAAGDAVRGVQLDDGERIEADQIVVAAGAAAPALLRPLGLSMPIEPIKGYSLTLALRRPAAAPRASITDASRKIVHARLGDHLRVAGFADLVGYDTSLAPARIQALCSAVDATFPGACDTRRPQAWAGLRPATPGGRPLIGASRRRGLWLNLGHGALGLTLAAGSAARLAGLMRETAHA